MGKGVEIVQSYRETVLVNLRKNFILREFPKLNGPMGRQYIPREQK